jgi:hypothetical protein
MNSRLGSNPLPPRNTQAPLDSHSVKLSMGGIATVLAVVLQCSKTNLNTRVTLIRMRRVATDRLVHPARNATQSSDYWMPFPAERAPDITLP